MEGRFRIADYLTADRSTVSGELEAVAQTDTSSLLGLLDETHREHASEIIARKDTSISRLILLALAQALAEETGEVDQLGVFLLSQIIDVLYEPGTALNQLMDNLPIAMFIMLPVYALLLKLFYFSHHRYYVENLVFAAHLHTFAFLVFAVQLLLPGETGLGWWDSSVELVSTLLFVWLVVYQFLALKRYFGGGRFATLMKFAGLMLLYMSLLMPAGFIIVLLITVATV